MINLVFWVTSNSNFCFKCRLWHTACASDEGEVIVFGGCANNLLVHHRAVSIPPSDKGSFVILLKLISKVLAF